MIPDIPVLLLFTLIMIVSVYFQTVTGFGLSMIVMGLSGGLGVASIATIASVVSLVGFVSSGIALRGTRKLDYALTGRLLAGMIPASILGVLLLEFLSESAADLIEFLLGAVIAYGGISFAWRPEPLPRVSSKASFVTYGAIGGLLGGMFAIPGPPLIFHLYRQPMPMAEIRDQLILANAVLGLARTLFVGAQGQMTADVWVLTLICLPVVALATIAGKRHPPRLSPTAMRRISCLVLVLMGASLMLPPLFHWLA
ncbi:TSUP family transporter [Pusillimonas sp. TS35]|uniref:sulfite exporter TauE/SafE family protein n=1 Tax=Paracandidimonas lactea TaxID=2895524 RepID=UPI00136E60A5|nr:sulfite exporter TauE/SafE family protein [Paracandidimonas lactea]MYN14641.1 TSUP family transporter [Pusillimonas sp. TS35]